MTLQELAKLAARICADTKFFVFPFGADKIPATLHGLYDAVDRPEQARALFLAHPASRYVGVPTGVKNGIICIDVDPAGMKPWLYLKWKRLGNTLMHRTPRGGVHIYYRLPGPPNPVITSRQICDGRPLLAHGVDILSEGRSVIWAGDGYSVIQDEPIGEMPSWMIRQLLRKPEKPKERRYSTPASDAANRLLNYVRRSKDGERNNVLFWASCRLSEIVREGGLGESEAIAAAAAAGVDAGLGELEAWRTATSGVRGGSR